MTTFSSMARKPGQTIKPKAAPRRNVQRHAQKVVPAAALTPESLPQSPSLQPASATGPSPHTNPSYDLDSRLSDEPSRPTLTPPPTAVQTFNPQPQPLTNNADQLSSASAATAELDASEQEADEGPSIIASEPLVTAGRKTRAGAVRDASDNIDDVDTGNATSRRPVNKRRKVAPQGGASYLLSRPAEMVSRDHTETPADRSGASVAEDRARASTADLLQQATAQLGTVSKIAVSIENRTRNLRPRAGKTTKYAELENEDESAQRSQAQRSSRSTAIEDTAQAIVDKATGRSRNRRRRDSTPEDPENHTIDEATCTMGSLTKDSGLGKQSKTGKELIENWPEISQRWKELPAENRRNAQAKAEAEKEARKENRKAEAAAQREDGTEPPELTIPYHHAQQMIVNGAIVVNPDSREVDYSTNIVQRAQEAAETAREYRKIDNMVHQGRIGKNAGLYGPGKQWDDESTDLFYKGLRMFGTDFEMIGLLFPVRTRHKIKTKYNREEKEHWDRVQENLRNREAWSVEDLAEMTGREDEWVDLESHDLELEEITARLEKEANDRNIEQGLVPNPDDADRPIPTIEGDEGARATTEPADEHTRRIRDLASAAVASAARPASTRTPVQKKTRPRRARDGASKVTRGKKGQKTLAGVEEVIGTVGEVER
jgi:transcription factor TFIIIB component B''